MEHPHEHEKSDFAKGAADYLAGKKTKSTEVFLDAVADLVDGEHHYKIIALLYGMERTAAGDVLTEWLDVADDNADKRSQAWMNERAEISRAD